MYRVTIKVLLAVRSDNLSSDYWRAIISNWRAIISNQAHENI